MDHEFGAWSQSMQWALQDMQLDNGLRISNFTQPNTPLVENQQMPSHATILGLDGVSRFVTSTTTPLAPSWTGPGGTVYFTKLLVEIPSVDAWFTVTSLIPDQEFWNPKIAGAAAYEGVASAEGAINGVPVSGPAWNEQHGAPPGPSVPLKAPTPSDAGGK